ncbi:MAG: hypothetical protein KZQ97_22300 [Candidatus Thiodiazotropha sp. (ex Dulcina madagascariensis)]|nr:hypothetical protein [Candidatus Thiodiazotropha sp. (ex Dulcina madagascariensis)]
MSIQRASNFSAECICKKVRLEIIGLNPNFTVCHCSTCQYLHAGPGFGASCNDIKILDGEEHIKKFFTKIDKKRTQRFLAEHGIAQIEEPDIPEYFSVWHFCAECGTKLYYRFEDSVWKNKCDQYVASVGFLHESGLKNLKMETEAYLDKKPYYYSFKEKTTALSEDETHKKYIRMSKVFDADSNNDGD